jgi:hypothetical protein
MRRALAGFVLMFGSLGLGLFLPAAPSGATGVTPLTLAYIEDFNDSAGLSVHQYTTVTATVTASNGIQINWSTPGNASAVGSLNIPGPVQVDTVTAPNLIVSDQTYQCSYALSQAGTYLETDQLVTSGGTIQHLAVQFDCNNEPNDNDVSGTVAINIVPTTPHAGYYIYGAAGELAGFGNDSYLNYLGDLTTTNLNQPIVTMATTPDDGGYWMVATDGGVFSFGDAGYYGSTGAIHLNKPIVGMASTPDGKGYWFVASDGGIFSFGDANFFGSTGAIHLNKPIVGMAATPDGRGYWLVASDGGIFSFGDANFFGSTGAIQLNKPIVGMAATPTGRGYWMAASDGGIFTFGDARFFGSTGAIHLNQPIEAMLPTQDGGGYWLVASDGGIFTFGDATFAGSLGGTGIDDVAGVSS